MHALMAVVYILGRLVIEAVQREIARQYSERVNKQ